MNFLFLKRSIPFNSLDLSPDKIGRNKNYFNTTY